MNSNTKPSSAFWIWLLLLAGVGGIWWRSRAHADGLMLFLPKAHMQVLASWQGRIVLGLSNIDFGPERTWSIDSDSTTAEEFAATYDSLDKLLAGKRGIGAFTIGRSNADAFEIPGARYYLLTVPHWALMALLAVPCLLGLRRRWVLWRRRRKGLCVNCGYDLRESAERCPECGAEPQPKPPAQAAPAGAAADPVPPAQAG